MWTKTADPFNFDKLSDTTRFDDIYIYIYTICNIKVLHCLSYCLSVNCQMSFTKPLNIISNDTYI